MEGLLQYQQRMLTDRGYRVIVASSGQDAILKAKECRDGIDILLSDVILPDMRGPEVTKILKESHPNLKVIYMSGYGEEYVRASDLEEEDMDFLPKPFNLRTLAEKIEGLREREVKL